MATLAPPDLRYARAEFAGGRSYLAACTVGLPTHAHPRRRDRRSGCRRRTAGRPRSSTRRSSSAPAVTSRGWSRVDPARVAIGSQASVFAGLIAACRPGRRRGAVRRGRLLLDGAAVRARGARHPSAHRSARRTRRRDHRRHLARRVLARAVGDRARWRMPRRSAPPRARHGARTLCDATQAVGWMPVDAADYDAVICHAYKWLCAPRGVAFLAISEEFAACVPADLRGLVRREPTRGRPATGTRWNWPPDASRFDVSPAWQAFVGAEPALELFASLDRAALHAHATGLAARVLRGPRTRGGRAPERDRHLEPTPTVATSAGSPRRESRHPAAPAARASPSTSSTTSRMSPTRCGARRW